jgi:hypothetical protein
MTCVKLDGRSEHVTVAGHNITQMDSHSELHALIFLRLRQSYTRVGKLALIKHQRYAHAKQFKRAGKALRKLKTYLGRTIRDITQQIAGEDELQGIFRRLCT